MARTSASAARRWPAQNEISFCQPRTATTCGHFLSWPIGRAIMCWLSKGTDTRIAFMYLVARTRAATRWSRASHWLASCWMKWHLCQNPLWIRRLPEPCPSRHPSCGLTATRSRRATGFYKEWVLRTGRKERAASPFPVEDNPIMSPGGHCGRGAHVHRCVL